VTTFRSRQLRALRIAVASGVTAALLLPLGVVLAWNQLLDSGSATTLAADTITVPDTPTALVAVPGTGGQLSHLFVAVLDASGVGGTVVLLPIGSATETIVDADTNAEPRLPRRLADVYAADGMAGLSDEVQGLLDVSFTTTGVFGRAELIDVLAPLGGVDVLLDRDVVAVAADGTATTLAGAGESSYTVDRVVDILLARRPNEKESERFARHREVWNGVVERVGPGLDLPPGLDVSPDGLADVATFMQRMLAGSMQVWQLAAAPILDTNANPDRTDLYSIDRAEAVMVFASVAPSAMSGSNLPISVMVDSPFNDPLVSRAAVAALLDAGVGVGVMREVSAEESSATIIESDAELAGVLADLLAKSFGTLETRSRPVRIVGVDATIILGADFVASVRAG
jgi:hypothetical protein